MLACAEDDHEAGSRILHHEAALRVARRRPAGIAGIIRAGTEFGQMEDEDRERVTELAAQIGGSLCCLDRALCRAVDSARRPRAIIPDIRTFPVAQGVSPHE